jgi:hypothetical protein
VADHPSSVDQVLKLAIVGASQLHIERRRRRAKSVVSAWPQSVVPLITDRMVETAADVDLIDLMEGPLDVVGRHSVRIERTR